MTIDVPAVCPGLISRDDGAVLATAIRAAWLSGENPTVDFRGERIASTGFLDEGIAVLAKGGTNPLDRMSIVNLNQYDRRLLDDLIKWRLR